VLKTSLESASLSKWEEHKITAGERRTLITHWLAEAGSRFRERSCVRSWERTGCGMTADGSGDELIQVSGVENYKFDVPVPLPDLADIADAWTR
jgi:hypothetical protein